MRLRVPVPFGHRLKQFLPQSLLGRTLLIMLVAVVVFLPVVLAYTAWVYRVLRGRITVEEVEHEGGY